MRQGVQFYDFIKFFVKISRNFKVLLKGFIAILQGRVRM